MAVPRVFISSTCYDLAEERDGLSEFCSSYGFDTTLSERGDVFYHPDLHTHLSCVRETGNCQLFILVIGGRFGGKYKIEPAKSITNAEYSAAMENGSPTFAFVKQDVLNDHNVWQRNKDKSFARDIHYPSIDKQEHAEDIFKFIDAVRLAPVNNGIFGFRLAKDIHEILRRQWAGMMFDYLQNRTITKQISLTNDALGNLAVVSTKIEELVKSIYRNVDAAGAPMVIANIENESLAEEFLLNCANLLDDNKFVSVVRANAVEGTLPNDWWDFLVIVGWATIEDRELPDGNEITVLLDLVEDPVQIIEGAMSKKERNRKSQLEMGYAKFRSLPPATRMRLINKYIHIVEEKHTVQTVSAA
jgi:hypothetical protein